MIKEKITKKYLIITIFGLAGTGTSTCGKLLAKKLGYDFLSTGNLVRQMANERGLDLNRFEDLMKNDSTIDLTLDQKISKIGKQKRTKGLIIDSRLAWYFIPDSFKIKFTCDDNIRTKRVTERDRVSFKEAKEKILHRENIHRNKYRDLYGIENYESNENFDFVINSGVLDTENLVMKILEKMP